MIAPWGKKRRRSQVFFIFAVALVVAGCATTPGTEGDGSRTAKSSPSPHQLPLKVALYMDQDFRQYTYRERSISIPLGEWLSKKLPASLEPLFAEIAVIPDRSQLDTETEKYQAVLRPRIRFATYHPLFRKRQTLLEPEGRVQIYTEWTLSDPSDRKIWIQEIVGKGEGDDRTRPRLEAGVEAAMADLLKKLQSALVTSPRVYNYAYGSPQR